ncbi:MAG TPA: branched-chain amino acid ABC transporter permease [Bdellovibrionales bacterium]|nr:branched-chain amino acid ABC transporter permease [Bdellovibrionales bacterium]
MTNSSESFGKKSLQTTVLPILAIVVFALLGQGLEVITNQYVQLVLLYVCANIIFAVSLNLVNGFTGQFSIGHAGFMAVGAYVSAYLSTSVVTQPGFFDFIWFAIAGGLVAAAAGYVVGLPSLRLRGDYLAIVTLGFGEIIRVVLLNMPAVGGARGLGGIPRPAQIELGDFILTPFYLGYLQSIFWVIVTLVVLWRLVHSVHGRTFLSVREDEIAAQAMGINTTSVKVRAFVIAAFFAGIAGSVFAHSAQYLIPQTFAFTKSVDAIIMVVLGGMGSITGSVFAAVVVTLLPEFVLRPLADYTGVDLRMVIYSLALILFMIARPQGIFGTREINDLWRRK